MACKMSIYQLVAMHHFQPMLYKYLPDVKYLLPEDSSITNSSVFASSYMYGNIWIWVKQDAKGIYSQNCHLLFYSRQSNTLT